CSVAIPKSAFRSVDLPAPLGPMIASRSPRRTSRSTPSTTRSGPYPAASPRTLSSGSATEVGLDHARIARAGVGRAGSQRAAACQHHDARAESERHVGVVLDDDERRAALAVGAPDASWKPPKRPS